MCSKHTFPTKKEAKSCVNLSMKRKGRNGSVRSRRTYYCRGCCGWHITSKKRFEVIAIEELISDLEHLKKAFLNNKQIGQKVMAVMSSASFLAAEFLKNEPNNDFQEED